MEIVQILFLVCCAGAFGAKIVEGKEFNDWVWPLNAALWCVISMIG